MSLHQLYNRAVSTAILLLYTVYWKFCSVCSFVFHFCCMNLDSAVFQTTRITFPAVGYRRFDFFVYNLLLTSPSYIRIHFKTLKLVFVISCFYKAFVQFSSHSIELILKQFLNYSAEENPCCIFFPRLLISSFSILLSLFHTQIMNCLARHKNLSFS